MWPTPEPGDIAWCRFPERPRDKPGPKPRPAIVLEVLERTDGVEIRVAYGTSQKLDSLRAGEFAIRRVGNPAAYELAGLSHDTKFDLAKSVSLPWDDMFFDVPPSPSHGQTPKLGSLHPGMMKTVSEALRAVRRSSR